jgi:hypothetical protein
MSLNFVLLDDILIERIFQPVSDTISDRIHLSRGRAACFCIDVASACWILSQASVLSSAVLGSEAAMSFLRMALLLLGLTAMTGLRAVFERLSESAKANPLRLVMRPYRAAVLLMLVAHLMEWDGVTISNIAELGMLGFAIVALYLGSCAARPPLRGMSGVLHGVA